MFPNNGEAIACAYHPVDEKHPRQPDSEYSLSKQIGEELTELAARQTGLRTVIARPSHVLSGTRILDQFTVKRVCGVLRKAENNPRSELYLEGRALWEELGAAAEDGDQPCSVRDVNGNSWAYQPNDARDMAHHLVCCVESDAALDDTFNAGAPEPFAFREGAARLGEILGREPLEIELPVHWSYVHDITKSKEKIGYRPKGDLRAMMDSAVRVSEGGSDYEW